MRPDITSMYSGHRQIGHRTTDHERQRPSLGAENPAGHRRIEKPESLRTHELVQVPGKPDVDRGTVTTRAPGRTCASTPVGPDNTPRTWSPAGNIVKTTSASRTASATDWAILIPAAAAAAFAGSLKSNPTTVWPALTRLAAIGPPMFPNPIHAIGIRLLLRATGSWHRSLLDRLHVVSFNVEWGRRVSTLDAGQPDSTGCYSI
jgi:hypothetical protein